MNENELIARNITLFEENKVLKEKLFHGECETADELREQIAELSALKADAELSTLVTVAKVDELLKTVKFIRLGLEQRIADIRAEREAEKTIKAGMP